MIAPLDKLLNDNLSALVAFDAVLMQDLSSSKKNAFEIPPTLKSIGLTRTGNLRGKSCSDTLSL